VARDPRATRLTTDGTRSAPEGQGSAWAGLLVCTTLSVALVAGCAHVGYLSGVSHTVTPVKAESSEAKPANQRAARNEGEEKIQRELEPAPLRAIFADTLIGLVPGTGDSTRRYLGRLRDGYTADTLNVFIAGDNRPGFRLNRLDPTLATMKQGLSPNPLKFLRSIALIPVLVFKSLYPDLAIFRDAPAMIEGMPTWGREHQVFNAMLAKIDSLKAHGEMVACVINTGDLVFDGRKPAHWQRFLRISEPLTSRVPYFAVAGNHERIDTDQGVKNWSTATGLPASGDRLYYCFDSADRWVRFIALDTNPIVDPLGRWTAELKVKYSDEEFTWLVNRIKEHTGPVIVMMHHPPFSSGDHRMEWQNDAVLSERRERMIKALHESGIAVIASGHEHSYQRALLTWPDAVVIAIVAGGAGAPLHMIPDPPQSAALYAQYHVAGSVIKPENVFTARTWNFTHFRIWFGGGEILSYAVDAQSKATQIDRVKIDLSRYGTPQVDQHKIPLPPAKGPSEAKKPMAGMTPSGAPKGSLADSTARSERILATPPPGKHRPLRALPPGRRAAGPVRKAPRPTTPATPDTTAH